MGRPRKKEVGENLPPTHDKQKEIADICLSCPLPAKKCGRMYCKRYLAELKKIRARKQERT